MRTRLDLILLLQDEESYSAFLSYLKGMIRYCYNDVWKIIIESLFGKTVYGIRKIIRYGYVVHERFTVSR